MPITPLQFELEDDIWWTTFATLASWKGFQVRDGSYGALSSDSPSDGCVKIVFAPEGRGNEPLSDFEKSSVTWVVENEAAIASSLLNALLDKYPKFQEQYGYAGEDKLKFMPDVTSIEGFRGLIGLYSVNVHPFQKDGIPYVGFEFGCTWDEEHGLGALMHGTRVVKIFGADTAIFLWLAKQDANQPEPVE
jgi:hypothetical protein